jgi:hypothetical protein
MTLSKSERNQKSGRRIVWSLAEEQAFLQGLKQHGRDWAKIKQFFVPGRSRKQIYTHYRYYAQAFTHNMRVKVGHGDGTAVRRVGLIGRPLDDEWDQKLKEERMSTPRRVVLRELEELVLQLELDRSQ